MKRHVSRAGEKLEFAIRHFGLDLDGKVVADFGSSTGGFVDCLLQNGAARVYSVDTSYGELDWKLRNNPKVVVMERTNAMHVSLPEKVDMMTIDVGWTRLAKVLPNALRNLKQDGQIIALIKPHYEADRKFIKKGRLMEERVEEVLEKVRGDVEGLEARVLGIVESPIEGKRAKNREFLGLIT